MSVVRIKRHRDRFTVLSTATLRTAALSLKARGLWALCLSYPDDWEFRANHLQAQSEHDGRGAVRSALRELEAAGLASLETLRGDDGRVCGKRWTIYEEPSLNPSQVSDVEAEEDESVEEGSVLRQGSGADEPETGRSVDRGAHRQTDFPNVGKPESRENRRTGDPPLRKNQQHERPTLRKKEQQQASAGPCRRAPTNGVTQLRTVVGDAAVALQREGGGEASTVEEAAALLVRRGVEQSVADDLAATHGAEVVRRTVAAYDARRRGPKPPHSAGWLVAAIRGGYVSAERPSASPLLTYAEMLRWCEANGGLHRTSNFESVPQPGAKPLFRRRCPEPFDSAQGPSAEGRGGVT